MQKIYPFKFLDAYTAADKDIFFGRDTEIQDFYEMVFQTDLLLVYGASGTGKTSLIQCGLASRFQSHDWLALYIRRGTNLNASFERAIDEAGGKDTPQEDLDWLDEDWDSSEQPKASAKTLSPLARKFKTIYLHHFRPIYLIFDQFEELYILGSKDEQAQFVETVKEILRLEQPIKIIFSIREEYLGYLYEFEKAVPELLRKKLRVEPMNLDKVRNVLLGIHQLKNTQIRLEEGKETALAEQIFDKIKGKEKTLTIQLPYLQVFLDKLYLNITEDESRKTDTTFTLEALGQMGDIDNVLRDFLEEQASKIAKNLAQKPETIWKILSPFVTLEGTKEPLNEAQLVQKLPAMDTKLISSTIKAFADSRILRFLENEELYEIAHDSLAKQIAEKRSDEEIAILEVQRLIRTQTSVKAEAREYFTERQLSFVEPYLPKMALAPAESEWIAQSRQHIQAQKEKEQQRQEKELKRQRAIIAIVSVAAVISLLLAAFALWQKSEAGKALTNVVTFLMQDAVSTRSVGDYAEADKIAEKAYSIGENKEAVNRYYFEMGFVYALADSLSYANELLSRADIPPIKKYQDLATANPSLYDSVYQKYFGKYIKVEAGTFVMGDTSMGYTEHPVSLDAFQMASTEVTVAQYFAYCLQTKIPRPSTPSYAWHEDKPIVNVSYYDALRYANWRSKQDGKKTSYRFYMGEDYHEVTADSTNYYSYNFDSVACDLKAGGYRLPTEAEWEYAARGGHKANQLTKAHGGKDYLYSGSDSIAYIAWYDANSDTLTNISQAQKVALKAPNALGLYDMSGNVFEWCEDWYDAEFYEKSAGAKNPHNKNRADYIVLRGGSWNSDAYYSRVANRNNSDPDGRNGYYGFRLIL